jgi:alanine dehydrogenase
LALADYGLQGAISRDPELARGVNVINGKVTHPGVAEALGMEYTPFADATPGKVAVLSI